MVKDLIALKTSNTWKLELMHFEEVSISISSLCCHWAQCFNTTEWIRILQKKQSTARIIDLRTKKF